MFAETFVDLSKALALMGEWQVILLLMLGTVIGLVFGAMPGIGAIQAMVLALPFTFGMDPARAMFFFTGIMGAVAFGGSISAILFNIPGTAVNAATCFDGHPMARKGEAGRALGISATASGLGAIFGIMVLVLLIPAVRMIVMAFGPPEFFMLILFGLMMVTFATRGNMLKGLAAAGVGIMISLIGFGEVTAVLRFDFGSRNYLWDGILLVPFLIGIFAFGELIHYAVRGGSIANKMDSGAIGGVREALSGAREVFRYKMCFLRSSVIGVVIGILPGIGGAVSNFVSYVIAMQTSPHRALFGTGHPEGVIASEAANDSKDGGALLPTVAFAIPGSAEMAVLLGIFILFGMAPGPFFIREHGDVLWALILGLLFSNLLTSTFGLLGARWLAKLTFVNVRYLIPVIFTLGMAGTYVLRENVWDVAVAVMGGVLGWSLVRFGFPMLPLIIGYILGRLAEKAFLQSLQMSFGDYFVFVRFQGIFPERPISFILLVLLVAIFLFAVLKKGKKRAAAA
ncbi:MAG: tripartite tricarboxylate transporter permease [Dehalococcoidia bacterium]